MCTHSVAFVCTNTAFVVPSFWPVFNTEILLQQSVVSFNSCSVIHIGSISKRVPSPFAPLSRSFVNTWSSSGAIACLLGTLLALFSSCKNCSNINALCLLSFNWVLIHERIFPSYSMTPWRNWKYSVRDFIKKTPFEHVSAQHWCMWFWLPGLYLDICKSFP